MSINDQMKIADEYSILESENKAIRENSYALSKEIAETIKQYKENVCNLIKNRIIEEGKSNNFELHEKNASWSMKYKSLEYNGDFHSDIKVLERINGSSYLKVEFILEINKRILDSGYSWMVHIKNQIEQKQKEIEKQKQIVSELEKFKESLNESDIVLKYTLGERNIIRVSEVRGVEKNYIKISVDELVKKILG